MTARYKVGIPHACEVCRATPGEFFGKLIGEGEEIPSCPNHNRRIKEGSLLPEQIVLVPSRP